MLVTRPAIEPWECDDCTARGKDYQDLQDHVTETGHTMFTVL